MNKVRIIVASSLLFVSTAFAGYGDVSFESLLKDDYKIVAMSPDGSSYKIILQNKENAYICWVNGHSGSVSDCKKMR